MVKSVASKTGKDAGGGIPHNRVRNCRKERGKTNDGSSGYGRYGRYDVIKPTNNRYGWIQKIPAVIFMYKRNYCNSELI